MTLAHRRRRRVDVAGQLRRRRRRRRCRRCALRAEIDVHRGCCRDDDDVDDDDAHRAVLIAVRVDVFLVRDVRVRVSKTKT